MDEKAPYDLASPVSPVEGNDFNGLRVGGGSYLSQAREGVNNLSRMKKIFLGVLSVWVLGTLVTKGFRVFGHHHPHGRHGYHGWDLDIAEWIDESNAVTTFANYSTPVLFTMEEDTPIYIANATFPATRKCQRQFSIEIAEGVNAGIVISREDVESATLIVESAWYTESMGEDIKLVSSGRSDILTLSAIDGIHSVSVILPMKATQIPRLHLKGPSHPAILIHDSASDLEFSDLSIESTSDLVLDGIVARDLHIKTDSGKVTGTFNVSKAIVFKTETGDIDATIYVQAPPHRNHTEGGHHDHDHDHDHDKHGKDHHGKHGKEHHGKKGHKKHHKKSLEEKRECGGDGMWSRLRALLPFKSDKHHGKDHKHHDKHHDKHDKHHGPHGHHPHGPPHGPPEHEHPHGPPPIFIGAFSSTGRISLNIHQPANVSTVTKALSHTGDVTVNGSETFKGFFEAATYVGSVSVTAGEGKEIEVIKEEVTTTGGFVKGLVKFRGNETEGDDEDNEDDDDDEDDDEHEDDDEEFSEWIDIMMEELDGRADEPRGPHGDGPRGPPPPPPPPHKGPGGPPPPPHKGPGGPPPPPPHRGPGGPHPHDRPPPPGFSKLFAKTDVGTVKVTF